MILSARGKCLLLAKDLAIVQFPLLNKLRIFSANYTWSFFSQSSVIHCRICVQPVLQHFSTWDLHPNRLRIGTVQGGASLSKSELERQYVVSCVRGGAKRMSNFHVPVPWCLCMFLLLAAYVKAPWVRRLVKSKLSMGSKSNPSRAVRHYLVSWRQCRRYRRRALQLQQIQPSVVRSPTTVGAIVYALTDALDPASDSLKAFLAQKFLRSSSVDADDTVYHVYRVASHLRDPSYETLCRSRSTELLLVRQLPVPKPCIPCVCLFCVRNESS